MSKIYKPFFNLPESIERYILRFCLDKRLSWDKVTEQFFKGGFYRLNLNGRRYVKSQKNICKKSWYNARPEVRDKNIWNNQTFTNTVIKFRYKSNWDLKKCVALVEFTKPNGRKILKWSGRTPVSRWLQRIKKFETSHPAMTTQYLSEPRKFNVKGVSEFYVKKREAVQRKMLKRTENKKAKLFWSERKVIKLAEQLSKYGFTEDQTVLLSFSGYHWKGLMFFKGTCRFNLSNGYQILPPCGKNRFNPTMVDKCFNDFKIRVTFSDGETRVYTPEKLLSRIYNSKNEFNKQTELNKLLAGANQRATNDIIEYFTHTYGQTQPLYIDVNTLTIKISGQIYFTVMIDEVGKVLFNDSGDFAGILL